MEPIPEVAIIVLTDPAGRVLMQHRGHDAHVEPGRWTPPGGHLEPGEDAEHAAHRELREETGLAAALTPREIVDHRHPDGGRVRFHVFTGDTEACQADVVVGEGIAMRFLTRREIAAKELTTSAARLLGLE